MTTTMSDTTRWALHDILDAPSEDLLDYYLQRAVNASAEVAVAINLADHVRAVRASMLVRRAELREMQDLRVDAINAFYEDQRRASITTHKPLVGEEPPASPTRPRTTARRAVMA